MPTPRRSRSGRSATSRTQSPPSIACWPSRLHRPCSDANVASVRWRSTSDEICDPVVLANCRAATPYLYPAWSINRGSCFMDNRRTKRSSSGYRPAKVSFAPDDGAHFCVVHNGSDQGLCIELTFEAKLLPDHFELSFDNFRTVHSCRIVWQEDNIAGVAFDRRLPQSPEGRRAKLRIVA